MLIYLLMLLINMLNNQHIEMYINIINICEQINILIII